MLKRSKVRVFVGVSMIAFVVVGMLAGPASAASKGKAYDAVPAVPGNVVSLGYEATATAEFGDSVHLAVPTKNHFSKVNVVMSSWGCQSGTWNGLDCVSAPNSTFNQPLTLSIYASDPAGNPGTLMLRKTKNFNIEYRPSADPVNCTGPDDGKWFDGTNCYNGLAQVVTFKKLGSATIPASRDIVWTVAYNTTHYGASPKGEGQACFSSSGGCGYDSLNVGAETFPASPFVGTDLDVDGAVWNTSVAGFYCDGGTGGSGTLRVDTGPDCWTDYRPLAEIFVRN